jgi:FtsP/CotA-like multicopper oxidase with cupredoxin domain
MMGVVDGVSGPAFTLAARTGYISTPDGNSVFIWGLAEGASPVAQYPGPTLIVNQGDAVTVDLSNELSVPVSLVFPGQVVTASQVGAPTQAGALTLEAAPGGTVRYAFTASEPGTYLYHSGTNPDLQVDMGLVGAIIVRPAGFSMADRATWTAYGDEASAYESEYLLLLTEMDPQIHRLVERGRMDQVDTNRHYPAYWFINGRNAPDTMFAPYASWLPNQPYNCMPMIEPGEKMLMRLVSGGRDLHPFHHHGNHSRIIARDGRLLDTGVDYGVGAPAVADLSYEVFTIQSVPGQTTDAIFTWTGEKLGWDIYGAVPHELPGVLPSGHMPNEYAPDHGKPFPVLLPEKQDLTFGGFWSGSPFLGTLSSLPPGEGGLNPLAGYTYMWHSHTEKEMTNNDIFPGGMMTMLIVVPPESMVMEAAAAVPLQPGDQPIMGGE